VAERPNARDCKSLKPRVRITPVAPNKGKYDTTSLNDVTDQGETEWFYQKVKVKPERGLTVFWPTDWTFIHRGIASPSQEKYIATGWYSY
jgi:hypothetical protein